MRSGATLVDLAYGYGSSANNGNPVSHTILPLNETQSYGYDPLNRLLTAGVVGGWSQSNGYDPYGNRWQPVWANPGSVGTVAGTPETNIFAAATNRMVGQAGGYDAAGNQLGFNAFNLSYDGENRQVGAVRPAPAVDPVLRLTSTMARGGAWS